MVVQKAVQIRYKFDNQLYKRTYADNHLVGSAVQTLVNFCTGKAADGFSTVILLLLIIGSILMLGIGIMGYYLSKIYEEIKQRPRYIVSEESGRRQRCEDNK